MGKIKRGILGGISGRVANVVGGSWKGLAYLRSLPLSVSQPDTAKQVNARASLTAIVKVAVFFLSGIIKPLMDRAAIQMSGYNLFIQKNSPLFPAGVFDQPNADLFVISDGKMDATPIATAAFVAGTHTLNLTWLDDSGEGFKLGTDEAFVAVLDGAGNCLSTDAAPTIRTALAWTSVIDDPAAGENINVYLAFRRFDGLVVGKTSYSLIVP